ncbi:MAG TPA: GTPase Era [Longimicrobiales bacterium]|nr:GTPase Era [Longimicrobiales bacterium]
MSRDSAASPTKAGYVALVGRPNAGKSTLLNRAVGEHLSIVTPKAQTTWQRVMGILTEAGAQIVFLDTPGLLEPRDLLQRSMLAAALEALEEADVAVLVVDATSEPTEDDRARILRALEAARAPLHVALNKVDAAPEPALAAWEAWVGEALPRACVHRISAAEGTGVGELLAAVREDLPEGPFLYPEEEVASQSLRFFVAELVRETIFERHHQEIPYSVYCQVAEFREDQDPVYIHVDVFVERKSQKPILVGKGGAAIRELGTAARAKIEHLLGRRVYLDLWVKPLDSWRRSRAQLGRLGFRLPADEDERVR